ncbi:hypothetical protein F5888DRAFT_1807966 [Russula emetica]|nr:hypothetical protein F5888DRAFT_1807966 [Russula emetica]
MTNFSDFAVQLKDFEALQNFWHITNGIYLWEYITTLDFELDIIRGRRSYRWTIWIYSLARTALLISIILNFVGLNVTTPVNCQVLVTLQVAVAYVSLVSASLLVTIRMLIYLQLRATWDPTVQACVILNSEEIKPTLITTLITDTILLVTMLVGLFRLLTDGSCGSRLIRLLWKQGIIWLLIATVAGVPPVASSTSFPVYLLSHRYMNDPGIHFLNLNAPFNLMFQLPAVIINTIAATRIYRSLADYTFGSSSMYYYIFRFLSSPALIIVGGSFCSSLDVGSSRGDTKASKMKWNNLTPISRNRIEVTVDTAYEQYPTSRTTLSVGTHQGDKRHELSVGSDLPVECAIETGIAK